MNVEMNIYLEERFRKLEERIEKLEQELQILKEIVLAQRKEQEDFYEYFVRYSNK